MEGVGGGVDTDRLDQGGQVDPGVRGVVDGRVDTMVDGRVSTMFGNVVVESLGHYMAGCMLDYVDQMMVSSVGHKRSDHRGPKDRKGVVGRGGHGLIHWHVH